MADDTKNRCQENEVARFRRDLSRVAFSPEYDLDYAQTVVLLLQAAATIAGCEHLNEEALVTLFRASIRKAADYDAALDELGEFAPVAYRPPVGDA
jgi:hypothetical protein